MVIDSIRICFLKINNDKSFYFASFKYFKFKFLSLIGKSNKKIYIFDLITPKRIPGLVIIRAMLIRVA